VSIDTVHSLLALSNQAVETRGGATPGPGRSYALPLKIWDLALVLEESPFCGGTSSLLVQLPWSGTSSRSQHVDNSTPRQSEPAQLQTTPLPLPHLGYHNNNNLALGPACDILI